MQKNNGYVGLQAAAKKMPRWQLTHQDESRGKPHQNIVLLLRIESFILQA